MNYLECIYFNGQELFFRVNERHHCVDTIYDFLIHTHGAMPEARQLSVVATNCQLDSKFWRKCPSVSRQHYDKRDTNFIFSFTVGNTVQFCRWNFIAAISGVREVPLGEFRKLRRRKWRVFLLCCSWHSLNASLSAVSVAMNSCCILGIDVGLEVLCV